MRARVAVPVVSLGLLTSCSFSIGSTTVSQEELEKQVTASVEKASTDDPEFTVACDGTLEGEVGATQVCWVTDAEGGKTGLDVEVTEVDGSDVSFSWEPFIAAADVVAAITDLAEQQGITVESLECDGDLPGKVDETISCTGTPADTVGDLDVTVTSVEGLQVNFDVQQAG